MIEKATFDDEVLERVADDFEAPHTIATDLARDLGREVTDYEVLQALLALATSGQVQAFVYETTKQDFVPVVISEVVSRETLWFKARKKF